MEEARAEHRISVSDFRTQLHDWQAKVSSLKQSLKTQDARFTDRQAELDAATVRLQASQQDLERRMVEIAAEQQLANDKRNEMERHLADMREWYRQKLRSLASGRSVDDSDMPSWESVAPTPAPMVFPKDTSKLRNDQAAVARNEADDDRDSQLGETLRSRGLVDSAALMALSNEARRQRKTLRQTLLASGVVTLYQLALIEAGNLGDLTLGRFRVIDRVRATPRENIYRVFDPQRGHLATLLRVLTDDEGRNEFTERFKAASEARHANLACVYEVLEIDGRPAALVEALTGVPSSDWPALAASPGVWLKLVSDAASALAHIHSIGLVHGRLTPDQFVLSAEGVLKVLGLGEPGVALFDPWPAGDLRSLGRVAFGWSQIGAKRRIGKGKAFPSELAVLLRRLEAGAENGMGDVISLDRPFADAAEIVSELEKLSVDHPCPPEAWSKLVQSVSESQPLRQSA